jgi:heme-degrading monooxygenase HmoA
MFAVIFIVQPKKDRFDDYLNLAKFLKPELEKIDGFIDNERFCSKRTEGRVLSLSTWRDEKAVIRWRTLGVHHAVQEKGRFEIFEDYHLRVGEITADNEVPGGQKLKELRFDETEIGNAKVVTISELSPAEGEKPASADPVTDFGLPKSSTDGITDQEIFESIYIPASCCFSSRGGTRPPPSIGNRGQKPRTNCAIAVFGSSATMGCPIAGRRPNSIGRSRRLFKKRAYNGCRITNSRVEHYKLVRPRTDPAAQWSD